MADKKDKVAVVSDAGFMESLQTYQLKLAEFDHVAQLRAIWIFLSRDGWQGVTAVRYWFERFLSHSGASQQYHETAINFWCKAVWTAINDGEAAADFAAFVTNHHNHLGLGEIEKFYSPGVLFLNAARQRPFPPDLQPLENLDLPYQRPAEAEETPAPTEAKVSKKKDT